MQVASEPVFLQTVAAGKLEMTRRDQMGKRIQSASGSFDYRDYRFTFIVGLLTFILVPIGSDILGERAKKHRQLLR